MNFPLYIAKRYLFAKKSRNIINIISAISIAGLAIGTMSLIIVLSVFNGLEQMVTSLFNTLDPQLKITAARGKTFEENKDLLIRLNNIEGVESYTTTLEENVLIKYNDQQYIGTVKGVDNNYDKVTDIKSSIIFGEYKLYDNQDNPLGIIGLGIAQHLNINKDFNEPIYIYVPDKNGARKNLSVSNSFYRSHLFSSAIFEIEQSYDSRYIFVPINYIRTLLKTSTALTSIEISLKKDYDEKVVRKEIEDIFDNSYIISNRYEQQKIYYKVMKSERIVIYMILTLIIAIASFNIISSLTMLIIEKKRDIEIMKSMGTPLTTIRKIFIVEGGLISIIGVGIGLVLGFILCWIQYKYGIIKLNSSTLIIDSYPIIIKIRDFIIVSITVLTIGFAAALYPSRISIPSHK